MDRSRRFATVPVFLGVAFGVGIGALIFRKQTRERVFGWVGLSLGTLRTVHRVTAV